VLKKALFIAILCVGFSSITLASILVSAEESYNIPDWIKNNAGWWATGQISDDSFVNGIQYLIEQGVMVIPETKQETASGEAIPDRIKNNARWWSQGQITDESFVNGIQWLIKNGIIVVGQEVVPTPEPTRPVDNDYDNDGIPNSSDSCPNEYGTQSNGCPDPVDSDNDGIPDSSDSCPFEYGTQSNGCPAPVDSDNDGIPDTSDSCPQDSQNDIDNDGVCGNVDSCPTQYGTQSNGCPAPLGPTTLRIVNDLFEAGWCDGCNEFNQIIRVRIGATQNDVLQNANLEKLTITETVSEIWMGESIMPKYQQTSSYRDFDVSNFGSNGYWIFIQAGYWDHIFDINTFAYLYSEKRNAIVDGCDGQPVEKWATISVFAPFGSPEIIKASDFLPHAGWKDTKFC